VQIEPHSKLAAILREQGAMPHSAPLMLPVNSSHHQAAAVLGDGLRLVAWCPEDGVKEAVESVSPDHFVLGVQWHPERDFDQSAVSRAIFDGFVRAAVAWHRQLANGQSDFESVRK
jgi:putative glutamine amidotransferase